MNFSHHDNKVSENSFPLRHVEIQAYIAHIQDAYPPPSLYLHTPTASSKIISIKYLNYLTPPLSPLSTHLHISPFPASSVLTRSRLATMPSKEAELLRQQVLRSQKIAAIKRNIKLISNNNATRPGGNNSPEDLPARAPGVVLRNRQIEDLKEELRELELKQRIQKASVERSRLGKKKNDSGQKTPTETAPTAETYLEANKTARHANEVITNSELDRACSRDLGEHCETSPPAELPQKRIAELKAESHVLNKMIERISAEILRLGEMGGNRKQKSQAGGIPTTKIPLEAERAMSHSDCTAAKKRILKRLQLDLDKAEAVLAQVNKNAELTATIHENKPKEQSKEMTGEGTKAKGKSKTNIQEEKPAGMVPAGEAPFKVENTTSHANETAPGGSILELPQVQLDNAQDMPTRASRNSDLLAKISEHGLREKVKKMTAARLTAAEKSKKNVQKQKPAGGVPTSGAPRNAAPHTNNAPLKGEILEPLHLNHDTTQAIASRITNGKNNIPIAHEHELKKSIAEMTNQRTKMEGKIKNNVQEQKPAKKVPTTEAPLEVEITSSHSNDTSPENRIPECPQLYPDSAEVPHADEIKSANRKPEEDPGVIPDNAKKRRYTPEPKAQEENPGKRKHIGATKPKVEKPDHTSATEYAEKTLGDPETEKGMPHAKETSSKKRKAEDPGTIPDSKKQRYSPEPKSQKTPPKMNHIKTEERGIESSEYISTTEYDEQDEEDIGPGGAEKEKAEQANPVPEGLPEASRRSIEEDHVRKAQVAPAREFVPFSTVGMYVQDPFVDEVDYEID